MANAGSDGAAPMVNGRAYPIEDHTYDVVVVPSWRQIIDLSDLDASVGTHTTGQSGNPASPHFKDLFPLWSTGRYHPLPFTRPAVEGATASRLDLLSGD